MKLLFFTSEFPYPPTQGGRADSWQRLLAFAAAGVEVMLVTWWSERGAGRPKEADLLVVKQRVAELVLLPIQVRPADLAWRTLNLWRMPSHAAARYPRGAQARELAERVAAFAPDAIWVDGLWPAAIARKTARRLGKRYFYRSHNIEHRYMARQAALATSPVYRFRLTMNLFGLKAFEDAVVRDAAAVFDISVDDLAYWTGQGHSHGRWLPPIVAGPAAAVVDVSQAPYDIGYVGNLTTPNNVEGVRWLLREVWPRLREKRPGLCALIAGSRPNEEVRRLVAAAEGVTLAADPVEIWPMYAAAKVLVNPVRNGSGLNIKSVEMLQLDRPIVSTTIGVGGLPAELRAEFTVEDETEAFAAAVERQLAPNAGIDLGRRVAARRAFSPSVIEDVIDAMRRNEDGSSLEIHGAY